ncbi:hypothetical protein [Streptomyces sp. BH104]|uniref:hypothetical protein n=1 Tax=Streptomyces sp. BH104 TaxID=3410407 RepID=UPI003BB73402
MGLIETYVCVDDRHIYPAVITGRHGGWLSPGFTLDAVRQLASDTQEMANEHGHDCVDQIKVIDGGPEPVVLHIRWPFIDDGAADAVSVVKPDDDGRYWIGGGEWTWHEVDGPLFHTQNETFEAWQRLLAESARRVGEIVRTQMPNATAALLNLEGLGRIDAIEAVGGVAWPTGDESDGPDGYGPFDTEMLGDADEVLRLALDYGRDRTDLELGGWRPARDIGAPHLHRIPFAPVDTEDTGGSLLEKARERFLAVRRKLLTESVPYVATDAREAHPEAVGLAIDLHGGETPFLMFLVKDANGEANTPLPATAWPNQRLHDRLAKLLAFEPTGEDLLACGWAESSEPCLDGAYVLIFPAA